MTKSCFVFLFVFLIHCTLKAQELFPQSEPASTLPKNVLGVRLVGETYDQMGMQRNLSALRLMYGITPKFTLMVTGSATDHHGSSLPVDLITHTHPGGGTAVYSTQTPSQVLKYPFRFNGVNVYGKYRLLSSDAEKQHFRIAMFGEWAYITSAHDEAEPNLIDDTPGYGGGLIFTYLKKHFATSLTTGVIIPGSYSETTPDFFGGELHTKLTYGRAITYSLSFGYLLYPFKYKKYSETNINLYAEVQGKSFESAKVVQNGTEITPQTPLLLKDQYLDVKPGLQFIFKSNLRLDLSVTYSLINKSFARSYPVYMVGLQRYFFL